MTHTPPHPHLSAFVHSHASPLQVAIYLLATILSPCIRTLVLRRGGKSAVIITGGILVPAGGLFLYYWILWRLLSKYIVLEVSVLGVQNAFLLFCTSAMVSSFVAQVVCVHATVLSLGVR